MLKLGRGSFERVVGQADGVVHRQAAKYATYGKHKVSVDVLANLPGLATTSPKAGDAGAGGSFG